MPRRREKLATRHKRDTLTMRRRKKMETDMDTAVSGYPHYSGVADPDFRGLRFPERTGLKRKKNLSLRGITDAAMQASVPAGPFISVRPPFTIFSFACIRVGGE
jgi:hypothetical protein